MITSSNDQLFILQVCSALFYVYKNILFMFYRFNFVNGLENLELGMRYPVETISIDCGQIYFSKIKDATSVHTRYNKFGLPLNTNSPANIK